MGGLLGFLYGFKERVRIETRVKSMKIDSCQRVLFSILFTLSLGKERVDDTEAGRRKCWNEAG